MAQTKFGLNFGGVTIPIVLCKSTDPEVYHFNRGYNGKPVKQINVVPTKESGDNVTDVKDIQKVVPFSELQQLYLIDKEKKKYIVIDSKELKKKIFPKSDTMFTYCVTDQSSFSFDQFDGDHYFILIQKQKTEKEISKDLKIVYSILHNYLSVNKQGILVSYISNNKEKYGLVYPVGNFLKLSVLHYSNFQRSSPSDILEILPTEIKNSLNSLFEGIYKKSVPVNAYRETSGEKIKQSIQDTLNGVEEKPEPIVPSSGLLAQLIKNASGNK